MKFRIIPYQFIILLMLCCSASAQHIAVTQGNRSGETGSLLFWRPDSSDPVLKIRTRDERGLIHAQDLERLVFKRYISQQKNREDAEQRKPFLLPISKEKSPSLGNINTQKNAGVVVRGTAGQPYSNINPADPSIAVGPRHVIQMINGANGSARFSIFDKAGNILVPSAYMDQLPSSSYNGGGDCITFYDQLTDRFVMTEFGDSSRTGIQMNSIIMAVSTSNDPTGSWYVYEFYTGFFPDYPKFGNWHDAWYGVTRDFTDQYQGNSIWAFDKAGMISGIPIVNAQRIRLTDPDNKYNSLVPVTLGGTTTAEPGSPGLFLYYNDDELTSNPVDTDSLSILGFKVNFNEPGRSAVTQEGRFIVNAFSSNYCSSRNCASSPNSQGYDVVSNRIMHKPMYRNFGTHQSIVANHTIDANGSGLSGIRWYELRKNTNWTVYQQGTHAPQEILNCNGSNAIHRFMGSIMMNAAGQILLAYNFSGKTAYASLAFTGRNASSPLNKMDQEEKIIKRGQGYGTDANRWGDYNDLSPDPLDDSLFWFTGMYGNTSNTWGTDISALKIVPGYVLDARITGISHPNACINSCQSDGRPRIRIRNNGSIPLNNILFNSSLNKMSLPSYTWSGRIIPGEEREIEMPSLSFAIGSNSYSIYLSQVNGLPDENNDGDSASLQFVVDQPQPLPFFENADLPGIPPAGWSSITNGSSGLLWRQTETAFASGGRSFLVDNFNINEKGRYAELISPLINTSNMDSLSLQFSLAAALYDLSSLDTLEVRVYSNCNNNAVAVYKKWGDALSTKPGFVTTRFIPLQSDWRRETIDLTAFRNSNIRIGFRVINNHGQKIYIDEIRLEGIEFKERDVAITGVVSPFIFGCSNSISPVFRFVNLGKDTLRSAQFKLNVDGTTTLQKGWTGSLARNGSSMIVFPTVNIASRSAELIATVNGVNGDNDQEKSNDSLSHAYRVLQENPMPLRESFMQSYAPSPWLVSGSDQNLFWRRSAIGNNDAGSIKATNFNSQPHKAYLYTPLLSTQKADSVFVQFDLAATMSTGTADSLSVECSVDCGETWQTVYKKWGRELATINGSAFNAFIPQRSLDWRKENIDLTAVLWDKKTFLLRFSNLGAGGNDLYLDNLSIEGKYLAPALKEKGYAVGPNPADDLITVRFYPYATALESIRLLDGKGRIVYAKPFAPGANLQYWEIPSGGLSNGIYFLTIEVGGRTITEKLIIIHQ